MQFVTLTKKVKKSKFFIPGNKTPTRSRAGVLRYKSLTMTYFHRRTPTIIGAKVFHCPVRNGKGVVPPCYGRQAVTGRSDVLTRQTQSGKKHMLISTDQHSCIFEFGLRFNQCFLMYDTRTLNLKGYRIKPHGQLVLVSYVHYCTSTPSLSTSWSRTTLQGDQVPGIPNLQTSFPLRCLQRLSLPYLATRQCHWHDNRYTSGASIPVLSY